MQRTIHLATRGLAVALLVGACDDSARNAPPPDAPADDAVAAVDAPVDVVGEVSSDGALDRPDVAADVSIDAAADAATDIARDSVPDASQDAGCEAPRRVCSERCVDPQSDVANCGACASACRVPAHGSAICAAGTCDIRCEPGYAAVAGLCVLTPTPRLLAPLSGQFVTTRTPTFRWAALPGVDSVEVQVCRDRACTSVVATLSATGTSVRATTPLPPGVLFWRARGVAGGAPGMPGATFEFVTPQRTSAVDSAWGVFADYNGDGRPDLTVTTSSSDIDPGQGSFVPDAVRVYYGDGSGFDLSHPTSLTPSGTITTFPRARPAGDINGDGFVDLITASGCAYLGGATGVSPRTVGCAMIATDTPNLDTAAVVGDLNADGYADLVVEPSFGSSEWFFPGTSAGAFGTPAMTVAGGAYTQTSGDYNGDGRPDLLTAQSGVAVVYYGQAAGLDAAHRTILNASSIVGNVALMRAATADVNADGYADAVLVPAPENVTDHAVVCALLGSATGLSNAATDCFTAPDGTNIAFGFVVASAGDVNGDGYTDMLISAPNYASGVGRAYVFYGGATGLAHTPAATLSPPPGTTARPYYGEGAAGLGDMTGAGFSAIAVSAPWFDGLAGVVYVYTGSSAGVLTTPVATIRNPATTMARGFGGALGGLSR